MAWPSDCACHPEGGGAGSAPKSAAGLVATRRNARLRRGLIIGGAPIQGDAAEGAHGSQRGDGLNTTSFPVVLLLERLPGFPTAPAAVPRPTAPIRIMRHWPLPALRAA